MPLSDRVSIAREILEGLQVTVDDLRPPPPPEPPLDDQDLLVVSPDPVQTKVVDLDILRDDLRRHVSEMGHGVQTRIATMIGISPGLLNNFLTARRRLNAANATRLRLYLAEQN